MKLNQTDHERLLYIEALLLVKSTVSRLELCERFGVSLSTATRILKIYISLYPEQMEMQFAGYGQEKPAYVPLNTCKPILFSSADQAAAYLDLSDQLKVIMDQASTTYA